MNPTPPKPLLTTREAGYVAALLALFCAVAIGEWIAHLMGAM